MRIDSPSRPRFARLAVLMAALLALGLFAACSSSGGASSASDAITIKNFQFTTSPVKAGSTVTVKNNDGIEHTVTADTTGGFNVSIQGGKTATFTAPSKAGTYKFHCNIHSQMHATLTVQ